MHVTIDRGRSALLVSALLILGGAFVGTMAPQSGVPPWTFALGLVLIIFALGSMVSGRQLDRSRGVGIAGVAVVSACLGTMTVLELGGDLVAQFASLSLITMGALLAATSDPPRRAGTRQRA